MLMPVMQIRPMRVHMFQRRMLVHVRMPTTPRQSLMTMQVMPVVMFMHMLMFLHHMRMRVPVLFPVQQHDRSR